MRRTMSMGATLTLAQNQLGIDRLFTNLDDFLGGLVEN